MNYGKWKIKQRRHCTLGFMVAEDDRAIVLTPNIHKYSEHSQDYMVEGIFTIPKSMVIEVKKLS